MTMYTHFMGWLIGRSEDQDEPMAGAGALLAGAKHKGETEAALEKARNSGPER
ncbi:MAG: hypothetical protein AB7S70_06075 [Hyphomicrobium sp.]|uniref:hypothetical protein n=1 Tax=Hyphomicrobium sp. TaxID=82 RepID=UPI003D11F43A